MLGEPLVVLKGSDQLLALAGAGGVEELAGLGDARDGAGEFKVGPAKEYLVPATSRGGSPFAFPAASSRASIQAARSAGLTFGSAPSPIARMVMASMPALRLVVVGRRPEPACGFVARGSNTKDKLT